MEMEHIRNVLEGPRYPIHNLQWYVDDKSLEDFNDEELEYYSQLAHHCA